MKSPSSLANGYMPESKSPFQSRDDRSPFKDDMHPLAYKFEDRITGESLIPKGDPMEAKLQELLRYIRYTINSKDFERNSRVLFKNDTLNIMVFIAISSQF